MQLKHIKLSGFKSFVDSTKISFPSNLVGVVGPNGCGKSNVIDAVRWVLGELSAKNLRGDSMTDVIFNGSDNRKASGHCSVELMFDNSMGKIGGEYASYSEISIKRTMTTDGQSKYNINNTRCRRKDVQDLFLGTGLGPNSYAIIEQGMVSKLVSSKPEELRTHIEEAAGVSKYRERRRETESRIKKTKDNLSRVNDIREEINRNIKRLHSQAKAAQKYNDLKEYEKQSKIDIAITYLLDAKNKKDEIEKKLKSFYSDEKIKQAEIMATQSKIDEFKTSNEDVVIKYDKAQKDYYLIGAEIAKAETNAKNIEKNINDDKRNIEIAKDSYEKAKRQQIDFKELSPKEKQLKIDIATLKVINISKLKEDVISKIKPLEEDILRKKNLLDSKNINIDDLKKQRFAHLNKLNDIQKEISSAKSEVARIEQEEAFLGREASRIENDIQSNNQKIQEISKKNIQETTDKNEEAIGILNNIITSLKESGKNFENILSNANKLKEKLLKILNIATKNKHDQHDEYLLQQKDLQNQLEETFEKREECKSKLSIQSKTVESLEERNLSINKELNKTEAEITKLENEYKIFNDNLRDEEISLNSHKLKLKEFELSIDNESNFLVKNDININALDESLYKDKDLSVLEIALEETQKSLSSITEINFSSPQEYIEREKSLKINIERYLLEKEKLDNHIKELVLKSSNSEAILTEIRQKQSKFNNDLNMLENEKSKLDIDLKALNENITNLRIEVKSHEVNFENYSSTLKQSGVDLKNIDHEAYKEKDVIKLQNELETAQSKILRLGAINLAAPSEIEEENTRLSELDEQLEDLNTALEKLSSAIKQIDKETKIKFQESFDSVNNRLKQVFPDLFGGGVASLSLTEDNPLYAGVVLEAKPPGKKNSSISQLSGGEKALTALALVFAIFELNPAPFCLLDEVDAPLDDLNTSRFINMVEKMSKNVQFIFITHNKVSMERSNHLMGVTMQEPGVSRIVSVDVNQAVEMAEV